MLNRPTDYDDPAETEIGGYFGLDLPTYPVLYPDALTYQSGRAAIRAVIETAGFDRVLLPAYVCNSVINAVEDSGAVVETYSLDSALYPAILPDSLPEGCALLYVNYFGLCDTNVVRLSKEFPANCLIIDNSQALFSSPEAVLATVYSPRKFVGVPDGGLLYASPALGLNSPEQEDQASIERMRALIVRIAYSAREGYGDFQQIAISLKDTAPLAMSRLTKRLLQSNSWGHVAESRRRNYLAMAAQLDSLNELTWVLGDRAVPMCYPLTLNRSVVERSRADMAARNVFVPQYWLDAVPRIRSESIEAELTHSTLCLPIDQRMSCGQVKRVTNLVVELLDKYQESKQSQGTSGI